uniref:Ovule protein n=1 Tax=Meloidogyne incognita TaxID=6306 RepID=A0A914MYL1_MELIC
MSSLFLSLAFKIHSIPQLQIKGLLHLFQASSFIFYLLQVYLFYVLILQVSSYKNLTRNEHLTVSTIRDNSYFK